MLDRVVPRQVRVLFLALCLCLPTLYVAIQYHHRHDLTRFICFGSEFQARELPEVAVTHPLVIPGYGCDGEFYSQIAMDPTLRRPDLPPALDTFTFRAQRIFLPVLAHILGWGNARATLLAYGLLNLGFWYIYVAYLAVKLPLLTPRSFLVFFALVFALGALDSLRFALTDLPSATLGLLALELRDLPAALVIALAMLTKPTGGLFLLSRFAPLPRTWEGWIRKIPFVALVLIGPACWELYVLSIAHFHPTDQNQFALPFVAWAQHIEVTGAQLLQATRSLHSKGFLLWGTSASEFAALLSLSFQAAFLLVRPHGRNPLWLIGAAYAVLYFCLGANVYAQTENCARTVLPLTVAFNFLLLEIRTPAAFVALFFLGNVGMMGGFVAMMHTFL